MTVRVNLLPATARARERQERQRWLLAGGGLGLLAVLAGVQVWAMSQVEAAEVQLSAAQTKTITLQGEVGELAEYQELAKRQLEANTLIQQLLGSEYSLAGVLQDVAGAMPSDTQLDTLSVTTTAASEETGSVDVAAATFSATGRTLESHAPGVERLLIGMEKYSTFRHLYMTSSTLDEPGEEHATYTLEGDVAPLARTGRYEAGLPETLR